MQELAFTLADGISYVEAALRAGLSIESFASRLSFFFGVHNDFLEEIAKFRAADASGRVSCASAFRLKTHAPVCCASIPKPVAAR